MCLAQHGNGPDRLPGKRSTRGRAEVDLLVVVRKGDHSVERRVENLGSHLNAVVSAVGAGVCAVRGHPPLYHSLKHAIKHFMARQNPLKPLLFAYLKAKSETELHEALDYLAPTRAHMRTLIEELRNARRETTYLESWCLKKNYTGTETTRGRKERPKKGMSKLYQTQYIKSADEWILRLPVAPLLENLDGKAKKTAVLVIWQEDRIVLTLPGNFKAAMRETRAEYPDAPKELQKKMRKKHKVRRGNTQTTRALAKNNLSKPPALPPPGVPLANDPLELNPVVWSMLPTEKKKQILERQQKVEAVIKDENRKTRAIQEQAQRDLEAIRKMGQTTSLGLSSSMDSMDSMDEPTDEEVKALTEAALAGKV